MLVGPIPRASQFVRNLDPGLDDVVAVCLERDRNKRVASAAVVERLLGAYVVPEEGSRIHVGLAERAMALSESDLGVAAVPAPFAVPTSAPSIREVSPSAIETTMPLPASAMAPVAGRIEMSGAPIPDATAPLPLMHARAVAKQGTLIIEDVVQPRAVGPRGIALLGDVRQALAQTGAWAGPASAMPSSGVTTTTSAVVQSQVPSTRPPLASVVEPEAHAGKGTSKKARILVSVMAAAVLVVVAGGGLALQISQSGAGVVSNTTAAEALNTPIEVAPAANPQPKAEPVVAPVPDVPTTPKPSVNPVPVVAVQSAGSSTASAAPAKPVPGVGTSKPLSGQARGLSGGAKPVGTTGKTCKKTGLFTVCK